MSVDYAQIDGNPLTVQVAYGGGKLYQRHSNGQIWQFNGPHASPRWSWLAGNDSLLSIAVSNKHLYKLRTNGQLLRYNESTHNFDLVKQINNASSVITSEKNFYYVLDHQGIATADLDDPSASYEELEKLYEQSKAQVAQRDAEITRLNGVKQADDKIIHQLQSDYEGAQAQNSNLTAELAAARNEAAKTEKALQDKIAELQKALTTAQAAEKKLADDLDAEKKKEHEEWKKAQEHDAEDHKALASAQQALEQSQAQNADFKKQVDGLTTEATADKAAIKNLEAALAEAKKKQELAEAELKKHFTDDISDDLVISGLERVIQGLKKEIEGQEILIDVLKKQLAK
ncbi:Fc.00g027960.m01.CDS01 [Cosmosporella sp. VM-42]